MNFLLAFVLLTIGFIVGMQPLITNSDDLFAQLKSGNIQTMTGVVVKSVDDASKAQSSGLMKDDVIVSLNGQDARREDVEKFLRGETGGKYEVKVLRNGSQNDLQIATEKGKSLGVVLYDHLPLPRLIIQNVKSGSPAESSGLRVGDIILSAANESVYSADDFQKYLGASEVPLMVSRGYKIENILLKQVEVPSVIVTQIYPNTPAEQAGLKVGDMLERVNGKFVQSPERAIAEIQKNVRGVRVYLMFQSYKIIVTGFPLFRTARSAVGLSRPRPAACFGFY
jgi:S1-C subfamily serine protease